MRGRRAYSIYGGRSLQFQRRIEISRISGTAEQEKKTTNAKPAAVSRAFFFSAFRAPLLAQYVLSPLSCSVAELPHKECWLSKMVKLFEDYKMVAGL